MFRAGGPGFDAAARVTVRLMRAMGRGMEPARGRWARRAARAFACIVVVLASARCARLVGANFDDMFVETGDGGSGGGPSLACGADACPVNSFCCGDGTQDTCDANWQDRCDFAITCASKAGCQGAGVCCYDPQQQLPSCHATCGGGQAQLSDPPGVGDGGPGLQCTDQLTPSGTAYSPCQ